MSYVHHLVVYLNGHQQFMVFRSTNDVDSHIPLFSYTNLQLDIDQRIGIDYKHLAPFFGVCKQ